MSLSKIELTKFAKAVASDYLGDKDVTAIQGITQDHIDAYVIPIMTDIEDAINGLIAIKIKEAFEEEPIGEDEEWWSSRR